MGRLWFLGEALIDFVPTGTKNKISYMPKPGGSPFNAAKAAAQAGAAVSFLGAVSTDLFGELLIADLAVHGVDCDHVPRTPDPTTLAFVDFEGDDPRYAFYNAQSATARMAPDYEGFHPGSSDILALGSISLIDAPAADNICQFALAAKERTMLALDPNARPDMVSQMSDWQQRIATLLDVSSIIKLSRQDLNAIMPGACPDQFAQSMLERGAALVVVTMGKEGVSGYTRSGRARISPPVIDLCDTVGAGDTIMGSMLAFICEAELTSVQTLSGLGPDGLGAMLRFASAAAALNCTMVGCAPPARAAIDAFLHEHY